jgi:hypothetical protein
MLNAVLSNWRQAIVARILMHIIFVVYIDADADNNRVKDIYEIPIPVFKFKRTGFKSFVAPVP